MSKCTFRRLTNIRVLENYRHFLSAIYVIELTIYLRPLLKRRILHEPNAFKTKDIEDFFSFSFVFNAFGSCKMRRLKRTLPLQRHKEFSS